MSLARSLLIGCYILWRPHCWLSVYSKWLFTSLTDIIYNKLFWIFFKCVFYSFLNALSFLLSVTDITLGISFSVIKWLVSINFTFYHDSVFTIKARKKHSFFFVFPWHILWVNFPFFLVKSNIIWNCVIWYHC